MSNSVAVQKARKKMQLDRLAMKGKRGYAEYYANMPYQKERARQNAVLRGNKQTLKDAIEALEIATITGEGLQAAKEAHAIAVRVVEISTPSRPGERATAGLTGA